MSDFVYPEQVCHECAIDAGGTMPDNHASSVNFKGICDVCGKQRLTTEPRDYGYPGFREFNKTLEGKK